MNAAGKSRPNATRSERRQAALRRRREQEYATRRARATEARRRVRRRRILAGVGIVVALLIVSGGVALVIHERNKPDLALKGKKIASKAPAQTIANLPVSYRLTYRVFSGDDKAIVEEVTVTRPFAMRYRFAYENALTTPLQDLVVTKSNITQRYDGSADSAANATPELLPFGTRYDATLDDLVANGFYERRERRKVLDTECTVYRTGAFLEGGEVIKASDTRYSDICVSDDGLMLEEVGIESGEVTLRTTVTAIEREPVLADTDFPVITDAATLTTGGVQVFDLPTTATPTTPYWQFASVPDGWTFASRQRVEVTKLEADSTGPAATKVSWVDVYTRGADLLIVRQGAAGAEPSQVDTTSAIDTTAGDLGAAKLVVGAVGNKVIVADSNGRFVQLFATTKAADLTTLASSLKLTTA